MVREIGCGVDHPEHLDDPLDPIEIAAQRILDRRDQYQADLSGVPITLVDRHAGAELAPRHCAVGVLRTLAREVEQIANPLGVNIVAERTADLWQYNVQFFQPLLNAHLRISSWMAAHYTKSA